jgi:hypothetical protein
VVLQLGGWAWSHQSLAVKNKLVTKDSYDPRTLEIGCGGVDWIGLAQDRDSRRALVGAVMNLRVP